MTGSDVFAVFLPGLNTFGDDRIHVGPLAFGRMASAWELEAGKRSVPFATLPAVGRLGVEGELDAILRSFDSALASRPTRAKALLVGHSAGGLTARALACLRSDRIGAILTVGSPHAGAPLAALAEQAASSSAAIARLARAIGYDPAKRLAAFRSLSSRSVEAFLQDRPHPPAIPAAYAECQAKGDEISAPLKILALCIGHSEDGDGMVPVASQRFGSKLGDYRLDHYAQAGAFFQSKASARDRARAEFARLADDAAAFFRRSLTIGDVSTGCSRGF